MAVCLLLSVHCAVICDSTGCLFSLSGKQPCINNNETDHAAEENVGEPASKLSTGHNCDFAVSQRSKFVWPGIDAIIEAYASHVEGNNSC